LVVSQSTYVMAHGDVDIAYGALFIADQGDSWAEVVEVTDLDSAVGTTNLVLVEQGSVILPTASLHAAREALRRAWESCGFTCRPSDRATARLMAFAALWEYGHGDRERSWTIATDREYDEWAGPDRWRVTRAMGHDRALHPIRVNGTKGLRRWLRSELDIEV
jgi:hypothetical protein